MRRGKGWAAGFQQLLCALACPLLYAPRLCTMMLARGNKGGIRHVRKIKTRAVARDHILLARLPLC